jgi:hypothetical protein
MNLVLKGWKWTAILRNQPWTNDDRKPCENDEIQIRLAKCGDTLQTVQVFVKVGSESSRILHLHVGMEWEHFNEWMTVHRQVDRWAATVNGHRWEDDSFAPTKDQTIHFNITGQGGGKKKNTIRVWLKLGNTRKEQIPLTATKKDCWDMMHGRPES